MKKYTYPILVILSILIGLYPAIYLFINRTFGLLSSKSQELLTDSIWNITFYCHIIFGGIALLIGWIQFSKKVRVSRLKLHRLIGKIYVFSVFISGISGIYIGYFATGGIISAIGFITLAIIWIYTTFYAFLYAKKGLIIQHQMAMYYSYAASFSAVTLRIWLPLLVLYLEDFITAYRIVSWLAWIPNMIIAYYLSEKIKKRLLSNPI